MRVPKRIAAAIICCVSWDDEDEKIGIVVRPDGEPIERLFHQATFANAAPTAAAAATTRLHRAEFSPQSGQFCCRRLGRRNLMPLNMQLGQPRPRKPPMLQQLTKLIRSKVNIRRPFEKFECYCWSGQAGPGEDT